MEEDWDEEEMRDLAAQQRSRLLGVRSSVDGTSDRLNNALRLAEESEMIGRETMFALSEQGDQLRRTHDKVMDVDENMDRARRVLVGISRRVVTNKILLLLVILLLIVAILAVVYIKWIRKLMNLG